MEDLSSKPGWQSEDGLFYVVVKEPKVFRVSRDSDGDDCDVRTTWELRWGEWRSLKENALSTMSDNPRIAILPATEHVCSHSKAVGSLCKVPCPRNPTCARSRGEATRSNDASMHNCRRKKHEMCTAHAQRLRLTMILMTWTCIKAVACLCHAVAV